MTPIIDTHQHLWDLKQLRLPWLPSDGPLAGTHDLSDYAREADGTAISRTVYMEVDVDPSQHVAEARMALDLCRRKDTNMVGAVVGGRPADPAFAGYIDGLLPSPYLKGVRQVLHGAGTPRGTCTQPRFIAGIRELGRVGLSFDICLPAVYLADAVILVRACPETRFVLDHCGNPDPKGDRSPWQRDIGRLAALPNVCCKLSGIVASASPRWRTADLRPFVEHCIAVFGTDRVVFGGDWPVCTLRASLRQWVTSFREIIAGLSDTEKRRVCHDNAVRWYRLAV
jgi:L-fuconolactonase